MFCIKHTQNPVYYRKVRLIQAYSRITYSRRYIEPYGDILRALQLLHIQNPAILRTQNIFKTMSGQIMAYSEHCITQRIFRIFIILA